MAGPKAICFVCLVQCNVMGASPAVDTYAAAAKAGGEVGIGSILALTRQPSPGERAKMCLCVCTL